MDENSGEEFEQPADVVVLAAFAFSNNRLLMLSDIVSSTIRKHRKERSDVTSTDSTTMLSMVRQDFENEKFNLYMGAGALGNTERLRSG